jgi:ABC-type uncharacterized transport system ATPase subunit
MERFLLSFPECPATRVKLVTDRVYTTYVTSCVIFGRVNDEAIVASELTRYHGDLLAVDRVSFDVQPGEVFGYLGPNGAGKTTTIELS